MLFIGLSQESSMEVTKCLFGFLPSTCAYDLNNAPIFFSLGEAISAFGLIFAVFQLKKKSWEIIFRIREKWKSNLFWYFSIAGLIAVGLSSFIRQLPINTLKSPWNYPIFYEFLGFLFFIGAPTSFFIWGETKNKIVYS